MKLQIDKTELSTKIFNNNFIVEMETEDNTSCGCGCGCSIDSYSEIKLDINNAINLKLELENFIKKVGNYEQL